MEELRSARTPDELASLVRRAGVQGALGSETAVLMERSLSFSAKTAADVMTPRTRVRTVPDSTPVATVIEAARDTGHSRFPVVGESVDDIRGLIHVKQAVTVPELDRGTTRVGEVMGEPMLVPPTMALDRLLHLLQQRSLQLAVVVDEYGGTAGIVTFEDLVEELVGDVVDEHDSPAPGIWREPDGSWLLSGLLRPDEIQAAIGLELPAGRASYETVAGLILQLLRRIPDVGDQVDVPGATLSVDRLEGRRIDRVLVRLHPDITDSTRRRLRRQPNRRRRGLLVTAALLLLAVGLIAANGFFVGAEFAVLASRRGRLEPLLRSSRRARTALRAIEQLPLMISACQFGITLASLGLGALAEPVVASLLTDPLAALHVPHELIHPLALAIALTLVSCLHMLLGEMVPKNLALTGPERAAMVLAPPLLVFVQIFRPIIIGLTAVATAVLKLLRITPASEIGEVTDRDSVAALIGESSEEGLLKTDQHELLTGALAFEETKAEAVGLPLDSLVTVDSDITPGRVEQLVAATGYSRFPVRGDDRALTGADLIGYIHIADVLDTDQARRNLPLDHRWIRPLGEIRATATLQTALATLRRSGSHLARLIDDNGQTQAVIALEDILEELVGEVMDATRRLDATSRPDESIS